MDISIIEMLWNPLAGIGNAIGDIFQQFITAYYSIITFVPTVLLYGLQLGFFYVIDCVQTIFRKMAGLDTYYVDGQEQSGDIVMSMLQNQIVVNIFIAVLVVSIMLLFVTTMVAIIRSEFTEKGAGNAKGPIIGRAVKSLAYFAIVPITCLFGIWISNVFLRSFDRATSGDSYSLSTTVFFAAAQDANRVRNSEGVFEAFKGNSDLMRVLGLSGTATKEQVAKAIDNAFLKRLSADETGTGVTSITINTSNSTFTYYAAARIAGFGNPTFSTFDTTDLMLTMLFYDLFLGYNYLIGYVGGYMAASLLVSSAIGLIQRLYELAILFVVSPAMVAFMPLDDGKKYQTWKGEFIKRVGMAYGPVIGLNLVFQILAVLQHVTLFPDNGNPINMLFNALIQLLFLIVGLLSIKEFSSLISNLVGSGDAMATGEGKKKDVTAMGQKMMAGQMAAARLGKEVTKGAYYSAKNTFSGDQKAKRKEIKNLEEQAKAAEKSGDSTKAAALRKEADEKRAAYQSDLIKNAEAGKGGLGAQLNMVLKGEGAKTGIGGAFGDLAKSAPALNYFTRTAIAERAKNGQSVLGQMNIWSSAHNKDGTENTDSNWDIAKKMVNPFHRDLKNITLANKDEEKGSGIETAQNDARTRHQVESKMDAEAADNQATAAYSEKVKKDLGLDLLPEETWTDTQRNDYNTELAKMLKENQKIIAGSTSYASLSEIDADKATIRTSGNVDAMASDTAGMADAVRGAYDDGSGAPGGGGGASGGGAAPTTSTTKSGAPAFNVNVQGGKLETKITDPVDAKVTDPVKLQDGSKVNADIGKGGELKTAMDKVWSQTAAHNRYLKSLEAIAKGIEGLFKGTP